MVDELTTRWDLWRKAYHEGYRIFATNPSGVVIECLNGLPEKSTVLDLGCGNGRNAIAAALQGHSVTAVDFVDAGFAKYLDQEISHLVDFHVASVTKFPIEEGAYDAIIMTRLLQYLQKEEVGDIITRSAKGLKRNGKLVVSYTASGGIFEQTQIILSAYQHTLDAVVADIEENGLNILDIMFGEKKTTHVPYSGKTEVYELIAIRR